MSIFQFFRRKPTAPVARDRLQILLAHERAAIGGSDIVALLQDEILAVIRKHLPVERDKVQIKLDRGDSVSTLEIEVEMPATATPARRVAVA
ncbi:MAG: cell division topological specificity factor MinE [Acidisphaera sp.]|nr:cell division topological specificity factor MinE [Acidisphaera sp.]MBV9812154.1 cell division topological specificity factor MinE [Acetobacteraceae bacterium]